MRVLCRGSKTSLPSPLAASLEYGMLSGHQPGRSSYTKRMVVGSLKLRPFCN